MINKRRVSLAAAAATASAVLGSTSIAQAEAPVVRITSEGGINLVPTPRGLGLGGMDEEVESSCAIGYGCAARTWKRLLGADANDPDAVITMRSNVGIIPTLRLAKRDQRALRSQFGTFAANGAFVGQINRRTRGGLGLLTISGRFDQTLDDHVRIVQVRQGTRTVFISVDRDNRTTEGSLPARASVSNLLAKARTALRQSWSRVPTTVLP